MEPRPQRLRFFAHFALATPVPFETFSDTAIPFCLSIKSLFGLPLRQSIGMVEGLLRQAGLDWPTPDFSTVSRRQKTLTVVMP